MAARKQLSTREVITNAAKIFHGLRWKYGIVVCPYCGSIHIKEHDGYRYRCLDCKTKFSDKTNTLMHGSKLSVSVWMQAIYEMTVDNMISSVTLGKKLGIQQKSAWLLRAKIDMSMDLDKVMIDGKVCCMDEQYIGGCISNYHYRRKLDLLRKNRLLDEDNRHYGKDALFTLNKMLKTPVFGITDGDKVIMHVLPNPVKKEHVRRLFKKHCKKGTICVSDESKLYYQWEKATGCELITNNHHDNQYVSEEGVTSNPIENKFSWFKRGFNGKITHCKYHQLYLNEYCFRYNTRNMSTEDRFNELVGNTIGKHYTYNDIKNHNPLDKIVSKAKREEEARKERKQMKMIEFALKNHIAEYLMYKHKKYTLKDFQ